MTYTQILVVIGTEQLPIVVSALELVAQVDNLLAVLSTLLIVRCASVNACIKIELSQNHVAKTLTCAILLWISRQYFGCLFHIVNQPIEELGTADLHRVSTAHLRVLVGERNITEQVDGMQIAKTADGASLGTILLHKSIVAASLVNLTDNLVTDRNLIEHTAVGSAYEYVA